MPPPDDPAAAGLLFGSAADAYERYRSGYREEVFAAVADYAGRPIGTALEIGAGTGKATRLFASHGVQVTALEPDTGMAAVLESVTGHLPVRPVLSTFERFHTDQRFDLVFAAAAWHWTDPRTRWSRAVERLVPGGTLALFGIPGDPVDPDLTAAIEDLQRALLPGGTGPAGHPWTVGDVAGADGLTDVTERRLPATVLLSADDLVARMGTVSGYLAVAADRRAEILRRIRAILPEQVRVDATTTLTFARRG